MNAMYFLKRLQGYKEEKQKCRMAYNGYESRSVTIHKKDSCITYFNIFSDGTVHKIVGNDIQTLSITDLEGDDFELFNTNQIVECGYIINPDNSKTIEWMRHIVIDYIMNKQSENTTPKYRLSPPGLKFTIMGVKVVLLTDYELELMNKSRKHYGATIIPFNDNYTNIRRLHFQIITNIKSNPVIYIETDKILKEVLNIFRDACNNNDIECIRRYLSDPICL